MKTHLYRSPASGRLRALDTRDYKKPVGYEEFLPDNRYKDPGLGAWIRRNSALLVRLFMVAVFTFGASTTAANFSYGLQGEPTKLTVEQLTTGHLPPGTELGDYVEITGSPVFGPDPEKVGTPESRIGISARYSAAYFYFALEETGDSLLVQTAQTPPDTTKIGEQVYRGKLDTVGTVIFHDTTQDGLENAGLPHKENIPVVTTGDTPEYYRQIFPAYSAIIGLWIASIAWLLWKKNKPFLGL